METVTPKGRLRGTLVIGLLVWPGCVVVSENVRYETRGGGYRGYMVEYVDAVPTPGTLLGAGRRVKIGVTVNHVLQSAGKGLLVLLFRDDDGRLLELSEQNAIEIRRGRSTKTTLSRDIVVPTGIRELWLVVQVVPDGERDPSGGLRIRYPVSPGEPPHLAPADAVMPAAAPLATAPVPPPAVAAIPVDFAREVKPILETRCRPCHFPGGRMYDRMPFDEPETLRELGEKLFGRIKDQESQATIRAFLSQPQR
jgi:hypothetical protein